NYEAIKRCNTLLANVGRTDLDEASKAQYSAEAKVIRALMYLNLTMTYHDVPFITTPQSMKEANTPKTDRATIVKAIMEDLKSAA
ncbi:RagB/SusD family nutrient uptake outer membrane protein, partial [Pseudomonas donghuensis]|nr:RagB/SusD family nutrient uptake outer membrane protein [Pseudomonas donghuensis]